MDDDGTILKQGVGCFTCYANTRVVVDGFHLDIDTLYESMSPLKTMPAFLIALVLYVDSIVALSRSGLEKGQGQRHVEGASSQVNVGQSLLIVLQLL